MVQVLDKPEVKHDSGEPWAVRAAKALRFEADKQMIAAVIRSIQGCPAFSYYTDPNGHQDQSQLIFSGTVGFGPTFVIDTRGDIIAWAVSRDSSISMVRLGTTREVCDELNRVADKIKATDDERSTMFAALKKGISVDYRAILDPEDPLSRIQRKLN